MDVHVHVQSGFNNAIQLTGGSNREGPGDKGQLLGSNECWVREISSIKITVFQISYDVLFKERDIPISGGLLWLARFKETKEEGKKTKMLRQTLAPKQYPTPPIFLIPRSLRKCLRDFSMTGSIFSVPWFLNQDGKSTLLLFSQMILSPRKRSGMIAR